MIAVDFPIGTFAVHGLVGIQDPDAIDAGAGNKMQSMLSKILVEVNKCLCTCKIRKIYKILTD